MAGALLESSVTSEVARQCTWADIDVSLHHFRDRIGDGFVNGVVLGCFEQPRPLGGRLTALPLSALWPG